MNPWLFAVTVTPAPEDGKPLFTPEDSMPRDVLILVGASVSIALATAIWAMFFRRQRRRRREHRPRNPTRAEVGGLPPARIENPANRESYRD